MYFPERRLDPPEYEPRGGYFAPVCPWDAWATDWQEDDDYDPEEEMEEIL